MLFRSNNYLLFHGIILCYFIEIALTSLAINSAISQKTADLVDTIILQFRDNKSVSLIQ